MGTFGPRRRKRGAVATVLEQLRDAQNRRDVDAMLECFDPDYRSEQPAHPDRGFGGGEQVGKNWSAMFESFPDCEAELLRHSSDGDLVWGEWNWRATGLRMTGVNVMEMREGRISWARAYMERIEEAGEDIDEAVKP
jgi:ketosteroid isomerase-like protein